MRAHLTINTKSYLRVKEKHFKISDFLENEKSAMTNLKISFSNILVQRLIL